MELGLPKKTDLLPLLCWVSLCVVVMVAFCYLISKIYVHTGEPIYLRNGTEWPISVSEVMPEEAEQLTAIRPQPIAIPPREVREVARSFGGHQGIPIDVVVNKRILRFSLSRQYRHFEITRSLKLIRSTR